ncbi:hypothetical protein HZC33_02320 [Candidatus Wolfebacteria bacterium]|nr:hypothetical protein [Candidatus Wolfebacteria bacterium]
MTNNNYDLVKMLFAVLDDAYRIDKYYLKDAEICPHCKEIFEKMKKDIESHSQMLQLEISRHVKENNFN